MTTIQKLIDIDFSKLSIQLKSHYKSSVWQHFGYLSLNEDGNSIIVSNDVYCNLCFQQNKLHCYKHSSSSSNLQRHLIICHNVDLCSESESKSVTNQHIIKLETPYLSVIKIEPKGEEINNTEETGDIHRQQHGRFKTHLNNNLLVNLALLCCRDQLPFDILNGGGFQQFLVNSGVVSNTSQIPSSTDVLQEAVSSIYNSLLQTVISSFSDAEQTLALTLEKWNENGSTYLTWRFHFSNGKFEQLTMTMPTTIKKSSSVKQDIMNDIDHFCQKFKLKNKSIVMVDESISSGESSLTTSIHFKLHRHYCISHALNDLVNIDGLSVALKSGNLCANLCRQLKLQNVVGKDSSLKQAYKNLENYLEFCSKKSSDQYYISWNALIMLLEFVDKSLNQSDCSINLQHDIMTQENMIEINQLSSFLKHLREALEILNGTPYTSCTLVLLLRAEVQRLLNMSKDDCKLLKSLKTTMADALPLKFPITDLHVCASLLDPSQRGWSSIQDYLACRCTTFVEFLTSMMNKFCSVDEERASETTETSSESLKTHGISIPDIDPESKFKLIESQMSVNEPPWKKAKLEILARHVTSSESSRIEREFQQYMCSSLSKESCDEPLLWWRDRQEMFPKLSELARIILTIPAGCSSMENISKLTERADVSKLLLREDDLVKILFIHDNYHVIEVID